ncbi:amidohydrolase 3 [Schizophyllum fasciatum]
MDGGGKGAYAVCTQQPDGVYTVDAQNTTTQCVVVRDAIVADTGSLDSVKANYGSISLYFAPEGAMIIPGMTESHMHTFLHANYRMLPLEEAKDIPAAVALVRNYILNDPDVYNNKSKVIEGFGWDSTIWPENRWPTAADLDADDVIHGRQVVLRSKDAHAYWVSGKTLEVNAPYPDSDVEGGKIVRDEDGKPVGVFVDNAQTLIASPVYTDEDLLKKLTYTMNDALSYGITTVHDAKLDPKEIDFFYRQALAGNLKVRMYGMHFFNEEEGYFGNVSKAVVGAGNGFWTQRSVKIVADGSLRSRSSCLYEDYSDEAGNRGFMRVSAEVLEEVIPMFLRDGWQVNVHGIGDRANGYVVTALEKALSGVNVTGARPRIEHAQLMSDEDIVRLGKLGVIASIQPTHVTDDMWYAQDRLGPKRVEGLYAFRKIMDAGSRITLGSDSPVETMNPIAGIYAAITRLTPGGRSPHGADGWFPKQRLTRLEALRGYTIDAAYAAFTEDRLGSLERGKRADFVVLSQDVMKVPVKDILGTKVLATAIDGEVVYGAL